LLDHPHWGFRAWEALGAKCASVERKDDGSFRGVDQQGSELRWQSVVSVPGKRVWYAEGVGRPMPLVPPVSLRAVLLLTYHEVIGPSGRVGIRHRAELFAQFDGKTANLVAKLSGLPADLAAKKTVEQVELFFSGMAWYLSENPAWGTVVFERTRKESPERDRQVDAILRELARPVEVSRTAGLGRS
jgi:hypothetical protein